MGRNTKRTENLLPTTARAPGRRPFPFLGLDHATNLQRPFSVAFHDSYTIRFYPSADLYSCHLVVDSFR